jgi:hypothetical protein
MVFSCGREASDHDANHANADHRLAMIQPHLIVGAQAPRFVEPAKGSLDNPALGQDLEALGPVATPHDFQMQSAAGPQLFDPLDQRAQVTTIGPDDLQPPKPLDQRPDQTLGRIAVLNGGAGNHDGQHQSEGAPPSDVCGP